jgi:7-cyano-7-deazaguanine synthase in queuosine biosynthesis
MTLPAFAYCVDSRGRIFPGSGKPRDGGALTRSAQVFVDGVQRSQGWLTHFGQPERDLLRVTAAILDLDRLSRRRPYSARAERRELGWRRAICVEIAVEDPDRWQAVQSDLGAILAFLSDDIWTLTFVPAGRFHEQCVLIAPKIDPDAEMALFSGGLDSSVGLRARHRERGGAFVAISAVGNDVRRRAQHDALQVLRDLSVEITHISIDHQLQNNAKARRSLEVTQRTRGLFFLAMGAAVCSQVGNPVFHIYETGVGCLNVPTSAAQVASQGTRAMHPLTVALFNALAAKVLDRPARAVLPFFFLTKGELCRRVDADLDLLARTSSSCDEGDGHKADRMEHCGLCTSCMFRRVAIAASGRADPTTYRDVPAKQRHNMYELAAFENHATTLSRIETFEDLTDLDPNIRHVIRAALSMELAADVARSRTIEMYRRYAAEIDRFLVAARPTPHASPPRPAQELVHDLFSAAR